MKDPASFAKAIFSQSIHNSFDSVALEIFRYQAAHCQVYSNYLKLLSVNPLTISDINSIPFLPIELFKSHKIIAEEQTAEHVFESSGTGGETSKHYIKSLDLYKQSIYNGFKQVYGDFNNYHFLALLPSYYSNKNSSLLYMVNEWMKMSGQNLKNAFFNSISDVNDAINDYQGKKKILLIGVSYSLLEFAEKFEVKKPNLIIMETGGMKGMKKEMIRNDLHKILKNAFHTEQIHSEYGMTELLSQCYSKKDGIFESPPWVKIIIRDTNDPFVQLAVNQTGGINIIDLANIYSCSFIATQDLGKTVNKNNFELLGRFDNSDIRGCNLLMTNK